MCAHLGIRMKSNHHATALFPREVQFLSKHPSVDTQVPPSVCYCLVLHVNVSLSLPWQEHLSI